jgi:hypothetical protein
MYVLAIPIFTYVFHLLDHVITRYGYQRPYYAVHALHNVGIVGLTVFDLHRSFAHLHNATEYPVNWWAIYLCVALHAYHIIDYLPSLRFDDWLHHGLMIGVAIPLGLNAPAGALFGANLFFTTGLPGLISYSLLPEADCVTWWLQRQGHSYSRFPWPCVQECEDSTTGTDFAGNKAKLQQLLGPSLASYS